MKVFKKDTFDNEAGVFWNGGPSFQCRQSKGLENADIVCILRCDMQRKWGHGQTDYKIYWYYIFGWLELGVKDYKWILGPLSWQSQSKYHLWVKNAVAVMLRASCWLISLGEKELTTSSNYSGKKGRGVKFSEDAVEKKTHRDKWKNQLSFSLATSPARQTCNSCL